MNKLERLLGAGILGIAAGFSSGCKTSGYLGGQEVNPYLSRYRETDPSSLQHNINDQHTSIKEVISEAKKYDPADATAREISDLAVNNLNSVELWIMASAHLRASKAVKEVAGRLHLYDHPLANLLERGLREMSYVINTEEKVYQNVLMTKKLTKEQAAAYIAFFYVTIPAEVIIFPFTLGQCAFGEGRSTKYPFESLCPLIYVGTELKQVKIGKIRYYPYSENVVEEAIGGERWAE